MEGLERRVLYLLSKHAGMVPGTIAKRLGVSLGAICHLRSKRVLRVKTRWGGVMWSLIPTVF